MNARRWITFLLLLDLLFISATPERLSPPRQTGEDTPGRGQIGSSRPDEGTDAAMVNPAAVYCVELGYEYQIAEQEDGGQNGVCLLPDGTTCL